MNMLNKNQNITPKHNIKPNSSKVSNVDTCSSPRSSNHKESKKTKRSMSIFQISPPKSKNDVLVEMEKGLMTLDDEQVPSEYFKEVHQYLKQKQFQSPYVLREEFRSSQVIQKGKSKHSNFIIKRANFVNYLSELNYALEHHNSIYTTIYLFDRLNDLVLNRNSGKIKQQDIYLNCCVALISSGKICQIYPHNLEQIIYLLGVNIKVGCILERQTELFEYIDWQLNPVSEFEFIEMYGLMAEINQKQQIFCNYLIELGLSDLQLCRYLPSTKAVAIIWLLGNGLGKQSIMDLSCKLIILNQIEHECLERVSSLYQNHLIKDKKTKGVLYRRYNNLYEGASDLLSGV